MTEKDRAALQAALAEEFPSHRPSAAERHHELASGYVVQAWNGRTWRKVRGGEGGPWTTQQRAELIAAAREAAPRRSSSTEGMPHRVAEVKP